MSKEERLDTFMEAIEEVCRLHDCSIHSHGYDTIEVRELRDNDAAIHCTMVENCLEED